MSGKAEAPAKGSSSISLGFEATDYAQKLLPVGAMLPREMQKPLIQGGPLLLRLSPVGKTQIFPTGEAVDRSTFSQLMSE